MLNKKRETETESVSQKFSEIPEDIENNVNKEYKQRS